MAETATTWKPVIEERPHPFGEAGVRSSLDEVAKRAAKGALHPRVRTWSIQMLDNARKRGVPVKKPIDRARVLLAEVQKKLWVPDPVGAEYIPGAHLLACDADNPADAEICVRGDDCDGKQVLLAASTSSVGIYTAIVGHAYDSKQQIEHVLCAVHLDGRWYYADPSTELALGKCVPFSRERVLSIPNVKVICDDRVCIKGNERGLNPDELNFVERGVFVGVDGPPEIGTVGLVSRVIWQPEFDRSDLGEIVQAALGVRWVDPLSGVSGIQWLGVTLIDLKDPQTMAEVKVMMAMIKSNYLSTSSTWSPADWDAYSKIIEAVADQAKTNKDDSVAYEQDGSVVTGWPPTGKVGFPNRDGILKMASHIVKINQAINANGGNGHPASDAEVAKYFPKIASYGINAVSVTAPTFGASPAGGKGGGSFVLPLVLGALALGAVGLAFAGSRRELVANCGECCENPLCENPLHRH